MVKHYGVEFRHLLDTQIPVLQFIPDHERLLAEGERVISFLAPLIEKRLTTFDLSSAPDSARPGLTHAARKLAFYSVLTHCLVFGSHYRSRYNQAIDMDAMFSDWILKSLTASSSIRQYDRDNHTIPTTIFNAVFDAEVEPVQRSLGLGWWRRMRNRNKFHNLFASGIVLGLLYDVRSKQAYDRGVAASNA
jgi:hypothetical protein